MAEEARLKKARDQLREGVRRSGGIGPRVQYIQNMMKKCDPKYKHSSEGGHDGDGAQVDGGEVDDVWPTELQLKDLAATHILTYTITVYPYL